MFHGPDDLLVLLKTILMDSFFMEIPILTEEKLIKSLRTSQGQEWSMLFFPLSHWR